MMEEQKLIDEMTSSEVANKMSLGQFLDERGGYMLNSEIAELYQMPEEVITRMRRIIVSTSRYQRINKRL